MKVWNMKIFIVLIPTDLMELGLLLIQYLLFVQGWSDWSGIFRKFLPIAICLVTVMQWRSFRRHNQTTKELEIKCYRMLPLKTVSKCWGLVSEIKLPELLRPYVYGLYCSMFQVDLSEALNEDLKSYSTMADFFARPIKLDLRQINEDSCLVSPCDGTVLHFGPVDSEQIEQVKGVTYSLKSFLGENTWCGDNSHVDYTTSLLQKEKNCPHLYHCVIYLAPGDYHRFHSPADWTPMRRRYFPGQLLSVSPRIAHWLPGLFCLNERSVYLGEWQYGFFSYTAVGATNVGNIRVYFDNTLRTNTSKNVLNRDVYFGKSVNLAKGAIMGEFRMGSTIVLVFQAPANFEFKVAPGMRVKMGQCLGIVPERKFVDKINTNLKTNINVK